MTYLIQFPDFDDHATPAQLLALGFQDISWQNDTCPSFERKGFVLYVDYADINLSELKGARFSVIGTPRDSDLEHGDFDNLSDALAAIA